MEKLKVLSIVNLRSEELADGTDSGRKEEKKIIERKTALSVAPCCKCGDQYSEAH